MDTAAMNWADWLLLGIIGFSCLISIKRGFFKEAISLLIWVLAFFVAMTFQGQFAELLKGVVETPSLRTLIAYGSLFALTLVVGSLINYIFSELVKMTGLTGTDRVLGIVFGLARGVIIVMALLILVPMFIPVNQDKWWNDSVLIPQFLLMETWCRETFTQLMSWIANLI